jgi:hypothetical protein
MHSKQENMKMSSLTVPSPSRRREETAGASGPCAPCGPASADLNSSLAAGGDDILLDQQSDVVIIFGLDVIYLSEARIPRIRHGASPLELQYLGSCGSAHHGEVWASNRHILYIKAKIQRRYLFADLTIYHL